MTDADKPQPLQPLQPPPDDGSTPPCPIHGGVQVRVLTHIGDGNTKLSDPVCPYCQELAAASTKAA